MPAVVDTILLDSQWARFRTLTVQPCALQQQMAPEEFDRTITRINHAFSDYWPCPLCFGFGWACCLCTLGLSFCCPRICISDAERFAREELERESSRPYFSGKAVSWRLRKSCGTSWIEVAYAVPPSGGRDSLEERVASSFAAPSS